VPVGTCCLLTAKQRQQQQSQAVYVVAANCAHGLSSSKPGSHVPLQLREGTVQMACECEWPASEETHWAWVCMHHCSLAPCTHTRQGSTGTVIPAAGCNCRPLLASCCRCCLLSTAGHPRKSTATKCSVMGWPSCSRSLPCTKTLRGSMQRTAESPSLCAGPHFQGAQASCAAANAWRLLPAPELPESCCTHKRATINNVRNCVYLLCFVGGHSHGVHGNRLCCVQSCMGASKTTAHQAAVLH
jgi:hypothetical protein